MHNLLGVISFTFDAFATRNPTNEQLALLPTIRLKRVLDPKSYACSSLVWLIPDVVIGIRAVIKHIVTLHFFEGNHISKRDQLIERSGTSKHVRLVRHTVYVERQWLIERYGTSKHVRHVVHTLCVERQRLIERCGITKHVSHVLHFPGVERQWLIERCGTPKHGTHVRHMGRVERQRLIERCGFIKHALHIRHIARVERRQWLIERGGISKH